MTEFETVDIDKNACKFQYTFEEGDDLNPNKIFFKVFSIPEESMRWYSYTLTIIDEDFAKNEMMTNNGYTEFSKKGIPEKMIEIASDILQKSIISSPTIPVAEGGDYLVESSYKVWERLMAVNDKVSLDEQNNHFIIDFN